MKSLKVRSRASSAPTGTGAAIICATRTEPASDCAHLHVRGGPSGKHMFIVLRFVLT
jgi:hypothetical protein